MKFYFAYAAVALFLAASLFTIRAHGAAPANPNEAYWASRIRAVGASAAYAELAHYLKGSDASKQHLQAHTFGGALFDVEGVAGLSTCDAQFSYGCFHELLGRAIIANGLGSVSQLNATCAGKNACQHGIGHGVEAYLGYDLSSLRKALGICESLPDDDPLMGCDAGAYMEYNLRIMAGSDSSVARSASTDMKEPCDQLPAADSRACYLWLPQWWWVHYHEEAGMNATSSLSAMRTLCDSLAEPMRLECVAGVGMIVPAAAQYDGARSGNYCATIFSDTESLTCREYAANVLYSVVSQDAAEAACTGAASTTECVRWAGGALSPGADALVSEVQ